MHKFTFYVPASHLETVKTTLFEAGAGKIGNYDCCCWQTKGEGQFRPLSGSQPFTGERHKINKEPEYQVEMVCEDSLVDAVIEALFKSHPYETPAFATWPVRGNLS